MTAKRPLWKTLLYASSGLAAALCVLALVSVWYIGAWSMVFGGGGYDEQPPQLSDIERPAVLVFTKTNSFRHKDGIAGGVAFYRALSERRGWAMVHTENGAVFNDEQLALFDAVVFLNATGDMLSDAQDLAFQQWMEAGGGWVGIHAAGDKSHLEWQWYRDNLIGADFTAHIMGPQTQEARVVLEGDMHPATQGLPSEWVQEEEWYSWEKSPRAEGFNILLTVDEDSYSPWMKMMGAEVDLRMGDHPVAWSNCVGVGRSIYSAMGHWAAAFEVPEYQRYLENATAWAMGLTGKPCVNGR